MTLQSPGVTPFRIHRMSALSAAVEALLAHPDDGVVYAGGVDLLPLMKQGRLRPRHLIDVKPIPELAGVALIDGAVRVGAAVTHRRLEHDALLRRHLPVVAAVEQAVGNVRVRNVGTIGGNLCAGNPQSDLGVVLTLLHAQLRLEGPDGQRVVPVGPLALGDGELLTAVDLPIPPARTVTVYRRMPEWGPPVVAVGVSLTPEGSAASVAVGCAGPRPQLVALEGLEATQVPAAADEIAASTASASEVTGDASGSCEYKRQLIAVLVARALRAAVHEQEAGRRGDH